MEDITLNALPKLHLYNQTIIRNNEKAELKIITIPNDWWCTQTSYDSFLPKHKAEIIPLNTLGDLPNKKFILPKPNYWEIKQGDYHRREHEKDILYYRNVENIIHKIGFAAVIIISVIITFFISNIAAMF